MKKIFLLVLVFYTFSAFSQGNAVEMNKKGIELSKKGQLDEAFKLFEKAIATDPNFAGGYSNRGNLYSKRKQYALAIADYTKSISLNTNPDIIFARANT